MKPIQNLVECSLLLQVDDPSNLLDFAVYPEHRLVDHDKTKEYIFQIDLNKTSTIKIEVFKLTESLSKLVVEQIRVNNVSLNHLNSFSVFKTSTGEIKKTYGYIDSTGVYQIKIHSNIISQNFIGYLLDLTK